MSVGDITLPVRPNSHYLGTVECRADEKQSVPEHGARHNGITFSVADAPEFTTVFGVISIHGPAAGTDHLVAPIGVDQKRGAERKLLLCVETARRFPEELASLLVQRGHKRIARAVATEDEG